MPVQYFHIVARKPLHAFVGYMACSTVLLENATISWSKQVTGWRQHFWLEDACNVLPSINGAINYLYSPHSSHSHTASYHDTHKVFHSGCCALWNIVFTRSPSHVPYTITAVYGDFCLITPENFFPVIWCPVNVFFLPRWDVSFVVFHTGMAFFWVSWPWIQHRQVASEQCHRRRWHWNPREPGWFHLLLTFCFLGPVWLSSCQSFTCALLSAPAFCSCHCVCAFKSLAEFENTGRSCTTTSLVCNFSKAVPLWTQRYINGAIGMLLWWPIQLLYRCWHYCLQQK